MKYRVFCQGAAKRLDLVKLVQQATRYFSASLEVLGERGFEPQTNEAPEHTELRLKLENPRRGLCAEFVAVVRNATASDYADAEHAERIGRASGMSELARRCPTICEIDLAASETLGDVHAATLNLCAIVASTTLGPVLPEDKSTLFGVRGAMERFERLVGSSLVR